jgi:hypothetical protein
MYGSAGNDGYLPLYRLDEFQPARSRPDTIKNRHKEAYTIFCWCIKKPQYPTQYMAEPKRILVILLKAVFIICRF